MNDKSYIFRNDKSYLFWVPTDMNGTINQFHLHFHHTKSFKINIVWLKSDLYFFLQRHTNDTITNYKNFSTATSVTRSRSSLYEVTGMYRVSLRTY